MTDNAADLRPVLLARKADIARRRADREAFFDREMEIVKMRKAAEFVAFEAEEAAVTKLLDIEDQRLGAPQLELKSQDAPLKPLAEFIVDLLREEGLMSKDQLRDAAMAAGYFKDVAVAPARAMHFTLMNMSRANRIQDVGMSMYGLPAKEVSAP